jgi:PAT family beta-lactamase induction signal transducer AmpG
VLVGFSSATQDIAMDAWRIEAAEVSRQGAMAAAYQWGYRIATLVAGVVPLLIADAYGWNVSYATMSVMMAIGCLAVIAAPKEQQHSIRSIHVEDVHGPAALEWLEWAARAILLLTGALLIGSGLTGNADVFSTVLGAIGAGGAGQAVTAAWRSDARIWFHLGAVILGFAAIVLCAIPIPGVRTRPGSFLSAAFGEPLRDFLSRYHATAALILALICLYRIPDFVLTIMNPFYLDLGFSLVELAEIRKVFGTLATTIGAFAGGFAVARYGVLRALLIGAFAGPLSNIVFAWLAVRGHDLFALFVAIAVDNVAGGFAGTCLIAYMSGLTSAEFTATQYALLSSLYAIPGKFIASQSGRIVESAAAAADVGGAFSGLKSLFASLPPESFATAMERSGVSAAALGSGYVVFFAYTALIGIAPIALAFVVTRRAGEE